MRLYHATDLHCTWGLSVGKAKGDGHWHTRLSIEALVHHLADHLKRGDRDWHLVLTGDLSDAGALEEHDHLRALLAPIWHPGLVTVVPGNHDTASIWVSKLGRLKRLTVPEGYEARRQAFEDTYGELMTPSPGFTNEWPFVKVLPAKGLAIVGLDSTLEYSGFWQIARGKIGEDQLEGLSRALDRLHARRDANKLTIAVALHHSPLGRETLTGLDDADEFLEVCDGRAHMILNGHLHGGSHDRHGTLHLLNAPSTVFDEDDPPNGSHVTIGCYRIPSDRHPQARDLSTIDIAVDPAIHKRHALFRKNVAWTLRRASPCAECEGPLAPEMDYCPWCQEENPNDYSDVFALTCHACTRPVNPGFSYCPWCEEEFDEADGRYHDARMTEACTDCDSTIEPYHTFCPDCGEEQQPPIEDEMSECDECGWPVDHDIYLYCPWCSVPL